MKAIPVFSGQKARSLPPSTSARDVRMKSTPPASRSIQKGNTTRARIITIAWMKSVQHADRNPPITV